MNVGTRSMMPPRPSGAQRFDAGAARSWRLTAAIAGLFLLLVGVGMGIAHAWHKSSDPWRSPVLLDLKARLLAEPRNEELKQQIRELDLNLRERYFHLLSLKATGVYLLFGGTLVFLYAGNRFRLLRKEPPLPRPDPDAAVRVLRNATRSRNAVAACSAIALMGFSVLALTGPGSLLSDPAILQKLTSAADQGAVTPYAVPTDQLRANWPRFRGWQGGGVAQEGFSPASVPRVIWHVPSPAMGFNSPIVWKEQILFTGGDVVSREVIALNAATGEVEWRQPVSLPAPATTGEVPAIPEMTGHAAATAATDGERVYAIFATGELVAFTLEGQPVWGKHLGGLQNPYGHATSLACWQDRVIVQLDQGHDDSRLSRLLALDGRTGEIVWQKPRPVGASWSSPIIIEAAGKPQIITLGLPWIIAYAASDGTELWRAKVLEGEITPSPVFANDTLYVVDPGMYQLLALRPDGAGDVTKTHEVWRADGDMPDISSPVCDEERVFTLATGGTLTCFNGRTGARLWKGEIEAHGEFQASPSRAGDVLLLVSIGGDLVAVAAGDEFRELWRTQLDDEFHASPAFAGGRMYLRGNKSVWCLAADTTTAKAE